MMSAGMREIWSSARMLLAAAAASAILVVGGSAVALAQGMTLDVCPSNYGSFPEDAPTLTCGCSAEAATQGDVFGANPYYWQSELCRAAVHAGAIGAEGGQIVVEPSKQAFFPAVSNNGVEGSSYGEGMGFKIVVAGTAPTAPQASGPAPPQPATGTTSAAPATPSTTAETPSAPQPTAGMTLDVCPSNYGSFPEDAPTLTCGCTAEVATQGDVYGANPYYWQSELCRAAVHAGAIGAEGGQIVVEAAPQPFYPAVTRNGVEGSHYGDGNGFRVVSTGTPLPGLIPSESGGMTLDTCPSGYGSFTEDAPPVTCGCSAEAAKEGSVYGGNPYYWQSTVCRAALHAGAIGPDGGQIVIEPAPQPFYPAVTRNGVEGSHYGDGMGFQVTAIPGQMPEPAAGGPAVDASGQPVQAPIAATLQATGTVQLYINFATDKDQPLPTSEPVLQELLKTLQDEPSLRLELIGHTDSQGSAPYNLDLSQRRAAAVYLWLIQHGVDSGRLRSDGRGLMEPIADNATDSGRALNRRVEAKAIN
jgi:outer membrane protein OmpA-like peptidoglycan-associated protein